MADGIILVCCMYIFDRIQDLMAGQFQKHLTLGKGLEFVCISVSLGKSTSSIVLITCVHGLNGGFIISSALCYVKFANLDKLCCILPSKQFATH